MSHVRLSVLGPFELAVGTESKVALSAKKSQALLCYLALHPDQAQSREKLASLLWTDTAEEFARTNLRQCLAVVRKALRHDEHPCVVNTGDSVRLDSQYAISDIQQFDRHLSEGTPEALESALSLYRGELVEGIGLDDCAFGEWLMSERRRRHNTLSVAFHELISHYKSRENNHKLFELATRLASFDPLDELAHRTLMHCHNSMNRRHLAIRQYETCKQLLESELDVAPERATEELYESILKQTPIDEPDFKSIDSNITKGTTQNINATSAIKQNSTTNQSPATSINWKPSWKWPIAVIGMLSLAFVVQHTFTSEATSESTVESMLDKAIASNSRFKPTIAVLPFTNMSEDADQLYFSDGLSEDIITDLSKVAGLTVIARTSSFTYRGDNPDISTIAKELNASVVLRGSVRRENERVRINAQLIDARDGTQLWADRYDRDISDVLKLQDEISQTIANELSIKLTPSEQQKLDRLLQVNPDAYDLFLKSLRPMRELTKTGATEARGILLQVVELDSSFARAWANIASTYSQDLNFGFAENRDASIQLGFQYAAKAAELDDSLPQLHFALSTLHLANRSFDDAMASALRAVEVDPNYADGYGTLSQVMVFSGELESAAKAITVAKRLNPRFTFTYLWMDGQIQFLSGNFAKAAEVFTQINERNPTFVPSRLMLIATFAHLNRLEDAEWEIAELLTIRPEFSIEKEREVAPYKLDEHANLYIDGLRKAGL